MDRDKLEHIPFREAAGEFLKVVGYVDELGAIVIMRNNVPRYVLMDIHEYDKMNDGAGEPND